jgi:predicted MFS family arabinose efflux permease
VFTYAGLSAGPPLAGFVTDAVGWRGSFALTFALGLVCFAICWRALPADREVRTGGPFDWLGTILLTASVHARHEGHRAHRRTAIERAALINRL